MTTEQAFNVLHHLADATETEKRQAYYALQRAGFIAEAHEVDDARNCSNYYATFDEPPGEAMNCPLHPETPLICPKCEGSKGGTKRAESHSHEQLSKWSKRGGRPRKRKSDGAAKD